MGGSVHQAMLSEPDVVANVDFGTIALIVDRRGGNRQQEGDHRLDRPARLVHTADAFGVWSVVVVVRDGLLALLSRGAMYGYQLRAEFEAATGSRWPLNIGQVYSTLQRMERDGLVATVDDGVPPGGDRRRYELTEAGRVALDGWFSRPVPREIPDRNEVAIKLVMAVSSPGVDIRGVIQTQRAATMAALLTVTRAKLAAGGDVRASLVAESVIFNAEAEVRWLDHCESRLADLENEEPAP
jgi:DNA-binding PadR family transcriptional regulator